MVSRTKREMLADSPLFDNLLPNELNYLAELFAQKQWAAQDVIFKEGDTGDALYVIAEGSVQVQRINSNGVQATIAGLAAPAFFGEMSLIDKEQRSATVTAKTPVTLLMLTHENLHSFAKNYRNGFTWVVVNIARALSMRLRDVNRRLSDLA